MDDGQDFLLLLGAHPDALKRLPRPAIRADERLVVRPRERRRLGVGQDRGDHLALVRVVARDADVTLELPLAPVGVPRAPAVVAVAVGGVLVAAGAEVLLDRRPPEPHAQAPERTVRRHRPGGLHRHSARRRQADPAGGHAGHGPGQRNRQRLITGGAP